jgi:hypothetical protein
MIERDMEDLIAAYPEEFFSRKQFVLVGRQKSFAGVGRFDLLFEDEFKSTILIELKARTLKYEDATQVAKYRDELKRNGWPLPYTRIWWLGTELNRIHWLFRPALCRRVPEPNLVDGARLELAFHGCRPWVIPLYEPPIWGEMRESNSRDWSHNPVPKPFGQSRHRIWSC